MYRNACNDLAEITVKQFQRFGSDRQNRSRDFLDSMRQRQICPFTYWVVRRKYVWDSVGKDELHVY
jgi:hypothetical protein